MFAAFRSVFSTNGDAKADDLSSSSSSPPSSSASSLRGDDNQDDDQSPSSSSSTSQEPASRQDQEPTPTPTPPQSQPPIIPEETRPPNPPIAKPAPALTTPAKETTPPPSSPWGKGPTFKEILLTKTDATSEDNVSANTSTSTGYRTIPNSILSPTLTKNEKPEPSVEEDQDADSEYYNLKAHGSQSRVGGQRLRVDEFRRSEMIKDKKEKQRQKNK